MAGPALIGGVTLFALRAFAFGGKLTTGDALSLFLPTYCHLGKTLAAGHIPAWSPDTFGGFPFAADPQSGWMYLPVMLLFSALPCAVAIRWFIVLQPILAGLGLYWFVRSEGGSRVAATVGGTVVALALSGSNLAVSPFGAAVAWTAVVLAVLSRYLHATTWASRVLWALLAAAAWGQLAAAHFGIGLIMGTGVLVAYVAATAATEVRRSTRAARDFLVLLVLLVPAAFLVNLAYLLPRLEYLPRTNLSLGYQRLADLNARFSGLPAAPRIGSTASPPWPLNFSVASGAHLAALALGLSFAGFWSRRRRPLVIAMVAIAVLYYALTLDGVAALVPRSIRSWPPVDHYLNSPERMAYELILVISVLAAFGLEAWQENRSAVTRLAMVGPSVALWGLLPLAAGAPAHTLALLLWGALGAAAALFLVARRPRFAFILPIVVAAEMMASILGNPKNGREVPASQPFQRRPVQLIALSNQRVDVGRFLEPGPIASALESAPGDRYLTVADGRFDSLGQRQPGNVFLNQAMLYGLENAGGYDSVQLLRYWMFVRGAQSEGLGYQFAIFERPSSLLYDLLDAKFIVAATDRLPPGTEVVVRQGPWTLYRQRVPSGRAVVLSRWRVAGGPDAALAAVVGPSFDPEGEVVLERAPHPANSEAAGQAGQASYQWLGEQRARVVVTTPVAAVVLVKNAYDPLWQARVDGRPAPVMPADYAFQAVPVPAGRHVIDLSFKDRWIGFGLLGSALAVTAMLAAAFLLRRRFSEARSG